MAQTLKIFRETALPGTLQAYAIYMIAPVSKPNYVEMYVTDAVGAARRIINSDDIATMINSAIIAATELVIKNTIAERDAMTPTRNTYVYVKSASGDPTVASGGATYLWDNNVGQWVKISEAESLDVALNWSGLQGKPNSAVADIDDAVTKRHTHTNKTQLDLVGQDAQGNFTYNGVIPRAAWDSTTW